MSPYKSVPDPADELLVVDRAAWRAWLAANHRARTSIWLIFFKKGASGVSVDYESAVLEALCFGWIDSKVQRIDDERYRQYFSARTPTGYWNGVNKARVAALIEEGLMTEAGFEAIETAKQNGAWEFLDDIEELLVPDDLARALTSEARAIFDEFSTTKKQAILLWIKQAKRPATRADRIHKTVQAVLRGETPLSYV